MRRSPETAWQMIGEEGIVMNLAGGLVVGFNPSGTLIWSLLEETDEDGLAAAVAERFDIDPQTALEDVQEFLDLLRKRGLVAEP